MTTGLGTQLVASSRPPSPTSRMATSTFSCRNMRSPADHVSVIAGDQWPGTAVGDTLGAQCQLTQQSHEAKVGGFCDVFLLRQLLEPPLAPPEVFNERAAVHRLPAQGTSLAVRRAFADWQASNLKRPHPFIRILSRTSTR